MISSNLAGGDCLNVGCKYNYKYIYIYLYAFPNWIICFLFQMNLESKFDTCVNFIIDFNQYLTLIGLDGSILSRRPIQGINP